MKGLAQGRKATKHVESLKTTLRAKMNLPPIQQLVPYRETILSVFAHQIYIEHLPRTGYCLRSWYMLVNERNKSSAFMESTV